MRRPWNKLEDEVLIRFYSKQGPALAKQLGRTEAAVKNRAQELGLIYRKEMFGWTDTELAILKEFYPIEGKRVIYRLPGRTLKTIQVTACRLGIKKQKKH